MSMRSKTVYWGRCDRCGQKSAETDLLCPTGWGAVHYTDPDTATTKKIDLCRACRLSFEHWRLAVVDGQREGQE